MTTQMVFGAEPGYVGKHRPEESLITVSDPEYVRFKTVGIEMDARVKDARRRGVWEPRHTGPSEAAILIDALRDTVDRARDLGVAS